MKVAQKTIVKKCVNRKEDLKTFKSYLIVEVQRLFAFKSIAVAKGKSHKIGEKKKRRQGERKVMAMLAIEWKPDHDTLKFCLCVCVNALYSNNTHTHLYQDA